jgi:hypothetical protein
MQCSILSIILLVCASAWVVLSCAAAWADDKKPVSSPPPAVKALPDHVSSEDLCEMRRLQCEAGNEALRERLLETEKLLLEYARTERERRTKIMTDKYVIGKDAPVDMNSGVIERKKTEKK